jgi:hypothetical protein
MSSLADRAAEAAGIITKFPGMFLVFNHSYSYITENLAL